MRSITSIKHTFPNFNKTLQYTIQGDSGLGRQLADALSILHKLPSVKLQELLPDTISAVLVDDFLWRHDEIQRELDKLVVKDHDKATLLSTDTSIFQLIPRSPILKVSNDALVYLAKQLFGKSQRNYIRKYCPTCHKALEDTAVYRWIRVIYI